MATQKIICITGGGRGIGAATAKLAAQAGYSVCLSYLKNREAAQAIAAEILSAGGKAIAVQADVSVEADVIRMFDRIDASLGRLTALVNNAGIVEPQARLKSIDAERLKRVFSTNVFGSFICAREAVRRMSTASGGAGGAIVNVSSRAAALGSPNEYLDYAASKGAIDTFTVGLAKEVAAEGIRVNAVRPGLIATEMHASGGEPARIQRLQSTVPMQRGGTAEEVARTIIWLLSGEASYVTGAFVDVSGGR